MSISVLSAMALAMAAPEAGTASADPLVSVEASEEAAIRETLQHYLDGQRGGGPQAFGRAFDPVARLQFVRDGKIAQFESVDWMGRMSAGKPESEWVEKPENRIAWIDQSGGVAVARIELVNPRGRYTDYMTLLKVDGKWTITNKAFQFFPKGE